MCTLSRKQVIFSASNYFNSHILRKAARVTYESRLWKIWQAMITPGTCYYEIDFDGNQIISFRFVRILSYVLLVSCVLTSKGGDIV